MSQKISLPPGTYDPKDVGGFVNLIATSPDSGWAAVTTQNGRVWAVILGHSVIDVGQIDHPIDAVAVTMTPRTARILVGTANGLFECQPASPVKRLSSFAAGQRWAFSGNCQIIAVESAGKLLIYRGRRAPSVSIPLPAEVLAMLFSYDGKYIAARLNVKLDNVRIWSATDGELKQRFSVPTNTEMTLSHDGAQIAMVESKNKITIRETQSGNAIQSVACNGTDKLTHLEFSADCKTLLACGQCVSNGISRNALRIFDLNDLKELAPLLAHNGNVSAAAITSNLRYVITGGANGEISEWKWDLTSAHLRFRAGLEGTLTKAYKRAKSALLSYEYNGLRMTDIWKLGAGSYPNQIAFGLLKTTHEDLLRKASFGKNVNEPFQLLVRDGARPYDILPIELGDIAVSQKVLDLLQAKSFTGWSTFPIDYELPNGANSDLRYFGLAATGSIGRLCREFEDSPIDMRRFVDVRNWDGTDFFSADKSFGILVSPRVLDAFDEAGITGWRAQPLSDEEWPSERLASLPKKKAAVPPVVFVEASTPRLATVRTATMEDVSRLVKTYQLERHMKTICGAVQNSIRFNLVAPWKGVDAVGATRFGGEPDLPKNAEWPSFMNLPQAFIGQIHLLDVAKFDIDNVLPKSGWLHFFMSPETNDSGGTWFVRDEHSWVVMYTPENSSLYRRNYPETLSSRLELDMSGIVIGPTLTLPPAESFAVNSWRLSRQERDEYFNLHEELQSSQWTEGDTNRLLGWPTPQPQADVLREIADKARKGPKDPSEWKMLLQVGSDSRLGVKWGDDGWGYVAVPNEDLRKSDFTRAWCICQYY